MSESVPSFSLKRFLLLFGLILIGLAGTYLYRFLELDITVSKPFIYISFSIFFLGMFLWYNRGKNTLLLKALFNNSLILKKADGTVSAPCQKCKKRTIYRPEGDGVFKSACPHCGDSGKITLPLP